jgi:hypothetical protein
VLSLIVAFSLIAIRSSLFALCSLLFAVRENPVERRFSAASRMLFDPEPASAGGTGAKAPVLKILV